MWQKSPVAKTKILFDHSCPTVHMFSINSLLNVYFCKLICQWAQPLFKILSLEIFSSSTSNKQQPMYMTSFEFVFNATSSHRLLHLLLDTQTDGLLSKLGLARAQGRLGRGVPKSCAPPWGADVTKFLERWHSEQPLRGLNHHIQSYLRLVFQLKV